jgi:hypothetical protein
MPRAATSRQHRADIARANWKDQGRHRLSKAGGAFLFSGQEVIMAKKGDLKTVLKLNVGLDEALAKALDASAQQFERTHTQEVRYRLREAYKLDRAPAEESAGVA